MEAKFFCFLEIVGVGFKAIVDNEGRKLTLKLGFSHDIELLVPKGMRVFCPGRSSVLCCVGTNFEKVSQFAATIKKCKPPEIYKGKGISYRNELIILKQGKKK
jgi:large subunit ribosomal protein L6